MIRSTETMIVGAGQAGLSMSFQLTRLRRHHVVLERHRVGDQWRARWDSLRLLTPNWMNRLDGGAAHGDPAGFLAARAFARYLHTYAVSFRAPVREGVSVRRVSRKRGRFEVETTAGVWWADNVVLATGHAAEPRVPAASAAVPSWLEQMHSSSYRNPPALPTGGVLVVGAGPSGQQIAAELRRAGRDVVLAAGGHSRALRRYRGRDIWEWFEAMGDLRRTVDDLERGLAVRSRSLVLSGANGGEQLDLAVLKDLGVVVAGRVLGFDGPVVRLAGDLQSDIKEAELELRAQVDRIDDHIGATYREWPHEPDRLAPVTIDRPPLWLDLRAAGIRTIVWATGYRRDYSWLDLPVLGGDGEIAQRYGISGVPGLYTVGLNFQRYRGSHVIGGVGADTRLLASDLIDLAARRGKSTHRWPKQVWTGPALRTR